MHATMPAATRVRLAWADTAKGLCILLVVLHHLVVKHYGITLTDETTVLREAWIEVDAALKPLRMPLFFLLSGIFAAGALRAPWQQVARKKVATPYYVYVVWLVVQTAFFAVIHGLTMNHIESVPEFATELLVASSGVWYLYALAAYFLIARGLQRFDPRVVLMIAALVSAGASWLELEHVNHMSLIQHFFYFALGAYVPVVGARLASVGSKRHLPVLVAGYLAAYVALTWAGLPLSAMTLLVSPLALLLAVRLAMAVAVVPGLGSSVAAIGRRTLPIYVLHMPVLALLHLGMGQLSLDGAPPALLALYPVVTVAAIVAVCLRGEWLLERVGAGTLFRLPDAQNPGRQRRPGSREPLVLRRKPASLEVTVSRRPEPARAVAQLPVAARLF